MLASPQACPLFCLPQGLALAEPARKWLAGSQGHMASGSSPCDTGGVHLSLQAPAGPGTAYVHAWDTQGLTLSLQRWQPGPILQPAKHKNI